VDGFFDKEYPAFRGQAGKEMLRALIDEVPTEVGEDE
jgi:hypothetical protein